MAIAELGELIRREGGTAEHIREQPDHQIGVARQKFAADGDGLRSGTLSHHSADAVHRVGELRGSSLACSFFQKVGSNGRRSFLPGRVGQRASAEHGREGNQWDVVLLGKKDRGAVGKSDGLVGGKDHPGIRRSRRGEGRGRKADCESSGCSEQNGSHRVLSFFAAGVSSSLGMSSPTVRLDVLKYFAAACCTCSRVMLS